MMDGVVSYSDTHHSCLRLLGLVCSRVHSSVHLLPSTWDVVLDDLFTWTAGSNRRLHMWFSSDADGWMGQRHTRQCVPHSCMAEVDAMAGDFLARHGLRVGMGLWEPFQCAYPLVLAASIIACRLASSGLRTRARGATYGRRLGREGGPSRRHQEAYSC
jgi:hypothetical protein